MLDLFIGYYMYDVYLLRKPGELRHSTTQLLARMLVFRLNFFMLLAQTLVCRLQLCNFCVQLLNFLVFIMWFVFRLTNFIFMLHLFSACIGHPDCLSEPLIANPSQTTKRAINVLLFRKLKKILEGRTPLQFCWP